MKKFLGGLLLILSMVGCSSPKEETTTAGDQHKQLSNAVHEPLDKARSAEKQVFDSAEQRKKQADDL
ncbi:MAG: hypothetical protein LUQ11_16575 [Methylococcaceae bacterium]|nr:hypothetical protein [Methylococcaceae bacterium]